MLIRFYLFNFLMFSLTATTICQQVWDASISGTVLEQSTGEPLQFVNVGLFALQDESPLMGTSSDQEGKFRIAGIDSGAYFLEVSCIGFETRKTEVFSIKGNKQDLQLGEIALEITSNLLSEVEVRAEKTTYNLAIDRKIYHVEKDILSQSSSATEILQNIPSISVDVDGQVSLRGTSNITYFINGKPSALMRSNSAAALRSISASTLERIEVITNPSAKYRPDGSGGIINLVLKNETRKGWNGSALGNVGNLRRYNGNLTLNYGNGDMNFFGSYGYRQAHTPELLRDVRISRDGTEQVLSSSETNRSKSKYTTSHVLNVGAEFPLGDNTQFGVAANYYFGKDEIHSLSHWTLEEEFSSVFSVEQSLDELEGEYEVTAAIEHEFEKEDHTLAIEFTLAKYNESEDNLFDEKYITPASSTLLTRNLIEKSGPLTEVSIEYALPMGEESELEAGYVGEFLQDDIRFLGEQYDNFGQTWDIDVGKTNHFIFTQDIHALYTTYAQTIEEFSFLAGLRIEQALINSNLLTADMIIPNDYFKLYPTLHLAYKLNGDQEVQMSYSRRVNRADSDEHNPFAEYKDPRDREAGNPLLKPEQIHSLELGYRLQKDRFTFIPSLYYRYKFDAFTEIRTLADNNVLHTSYVNLSSETSAGLELILSGQIKKRLTFIFSSNTFYNEIDASNLGLSDKRSAISSESKLALSANITNSTFAQVNAHHRSAQVTPQGESRPRFLLNLGLRQDVFKNKASIVLTVSDVFASLKWERIIDTPQLYRNRSYKRNQQIIHVGFTYRFGQNNVRERSNLDFEDKI